MSGVEQGVPPIASPAAEPDPFDLGAYARERMRALRAGELGSLPVIFGLVLIVAFFQYRNDNFISPGNLVNLMRQMAGLTIIAIGVVFVLLLGEIDLSVGYVSGVCGSIAALLLLQDGSWELPGIVAIAIAVAAGAAIGLLHGAVITRIGVPSFVVTLAGLLAWNGVVLILMSGKGTVVIQDGLVLGIANDYLPEALALAFVVVAGLLFGAFQVARFRSQRRVGIETDQPAIIAIKVIGLTIVGLAVVAYANRDRGVPWVAVVVIALVIFWTFVATRTRFGRHIYAVGGNAEAARRAGINVTRIRVAVFMISGGMAAFGGIIFASRLRSVDVSAGGGDILLNAIAAAVIGGTSLFGGRGQVSSALLGGLVIASVANGMALISLDAGPQFVVTGLILLAAATVDSLSRRKLAATGR